MIKIKSKLEKNNFNGVILKKGLNNVSKTDYEKLNNNKTYLIFVKNGFITKIEAIDSNVTKNPENPDFSTMNYQELKQYVRKNNIKTDSMSKADILRALGI